MINVGNISYSWRWTYYRVGGDLSLINNIVCEMMKFCYLDNVEFEWD